MLIDNKKKRKKKKSENKSFAQVTLHLFSIIFFISGLLLLVLTEQMQQAALKEFKGIASGTSIVIQQFLGNAYILLSIMIYLAKEFKGKPLYTTLTALFFMGFINLYLIFQFNDFIFLPIIYFIFQSLLIFIIFFALIDELRKSKIYS